MRNWISGLPGMCFVRACSKSYFLGITQRTYICVQPFLLLDSLIPFLHSSERVASMMMDKPLNKATIATLEKVFQTIRYPDEAVLRWAQYERLL